MARKGVEVKRVHDWKNDKQIPRNKEQKYSRIVPVFKMRKGETC